MENAGTEAAMAGGRIIDLGENRRFRALLRSRRDSRGCGSEDSSSRRLLFQIDVRDWNPKSISCLIGEAVSEEFEGKTLNPSGVEINQLVSVFKSRRRLHLLEPRP
jgi:hypothetical protein